MRLIDADVAERWMERNEAYMDAEILRAIPTVVAIPLSDLLTLRDWLYEHDAITMEGLAQLNELIEKSKREGDHE